MSTHLDLPNRCFQALQTLQEQSYELPPPQQEIFTSTLQQLSTDLQELVASYQSLFEEKLTTKNLTTNAQQLECTIAQQAFQIRDLEERLQKAQSHHRIATQALTKSEARLQAILQHSSDIITIVEADGQIRYVSPAVERILGYKPQDRIGKFHGELLHPDDVAAWQLYFAKLLETSGTLPPIEYRKCHKNGSWVYLEVIASNLLKNSHLKGLVINARDITERKQVEVALLKSSQQIIKVLESITDGFFALDRQWQFTYLNPKAEDFFQKSRQTLIGQEVWEELPTEMRISFFNEFNQAMSEQVAVEFEEFCQPLGVWFEISAYPSEEGLSVYLRDITVRKLAAEEARQQQDREEPFWVRYVTPPKRSKK
ncbi:MAG: PAS domain-containing protein [Actinomycetota bacterium]